MINKFNIDEVRDFWDSVADIYESSNAKVGYVHYQRYEKALESGDLKSGQRVLNVWSRMGGLIPYLRKVDGLELYNREVSPEFRKVAKTKYPDENIESTDLEDFSEFPDNHFDRIISLETLEHVPKPSKYLAELYRVLKPGGIIVLSLPPRGFEIPTIIWDALFGNHGEGPHLFLWPKQVKKLLKEAHFESIKSEPIIIVPAGNDKFERKSEKILTPIFGWTPLAWIISVRYFYKATKK